MRKLHSISPPIADEILRAAGALLYGGGCHPTKPRFQVLTTGELAYTTYSGYVNTLSKGMQHEWAKVYPPSEMHIEKARGMFV